MRSVNLRMPLHMIRKFWNDRRGSYTLATIGVTVPLLGALAVGVDFTEMSRGKQATLNALDAAGIATARRIIEGGKDADMLAYARQFFDANLRGVNPDDVTLTVTLPNNSAGGGTLKLKATLKYNSYFFETFAELSGFDPEQLNYTAQTEIKLKNTAEVALVLDNSGSMDFIGTGSGKKRMVLLKEAAKQLVDTMAAQAQQMKQLDKPVQFSVVPFAASVNVGPDNKSASWMDTDGVSPIHHENFDWTSFGTAKTSPNKYVEMIAGAAWARGKDWGTLRDTRLTRFTLYDNTKVITGSTTSKGVTTYTYANAASWEGCVETRPYPYNINNGAASKSTPASLFVPMFAPDEAGNKWTLDLVGTVGKILGFSSYNSWWDDNTTGTSTVLATQRARQRDMTKYFVAAPRGTTMPDAHDGPNQSCTTKPVLPLTDVSKTAGVTKVKDAIDAMESNGATNVPEGMAWGWRTVSSGQALGTGRTETERGNDKVVIVLTDGANTYYTPGSLGSQDYAGNKSIYSSFGYTGQTYSGATTTRLFMNTTVNKSTYTNDNYTSAMNQQFAELCTNAKKAGITVMTVGLDLNSNDKTDKGQIDALTTCASDSKFRKDPVTGKPIKLFWNATGKSLLEDFKKIADELSNLRIVS